MVKKKLDSYLKEVDPDEDREDNFISLLADTSILLGNPRLAQLFL